VKPYPDMDRGAVVDAWLGGMLVLGLEIVRARFLTPLGKTRGFGMTYLKTKQKCRLLMNWPGGGELNPPRYGF
jgi:hypothetical protein